MIPSHISHYYVRGSKPFQTISELDDEAWQKLCIELSERQKNDPTYNRRFGPRYHKVRLEAEEKLRGLFQEKGGIIERKNPVYFCLGSSDWWLRFCDHREISIDLKDIDPATISFTYPDSFTSMGMLEHFGLRHESRPYHGKVYTLDEIRDVVSEFGMPEGSSASAYTEYHKENLEIYIEAQLWSDEPLRRFTKKGAIKSELSTPFARASLTT
jgi:hypothetical protein